MGYRVHRDDEKFKVVEVVEGEVREVKTGLEQKTAKNLAAELNLGNGFAGWTPNFFLNRFSVAV